MKIGIFGTGGIGAFFGIKLAEYIQKSNEHQLYFFARGENYNVLKTQGLKLISDCGDKHVSNLNVIDTSSDTPYPDLDIMLVCTKSYALDGSIQLFKTKLSHKTVILPFLNGIDATERIQNAMPNFTVLTGCVYVFARLVQPGVVQHTGTFSAMHFGPISETTENFFKIAKAAEINVHLHADPRPIVWEKWSVISTTAGLNCFFNGPNSKIVETEDHLNFFKQIHTEFCEVAHAYGVTLPADAQEKLITKINSTLTAKSSMYADFEKGTKTEVDSLIGHLLILADRKHIKIDGFTQIYRAITGKERP